MSQKKTQPSSGPPAMRQRTAAIGHGPIFSPPLYCLRPTSSTSKSYVPAGMASNSLSPASISPSYSRASPMSDMSLSVLSLIPYLYPLRMKSRIAGHTDTTQLTISSGYAASLWPLVA